MQAQDRLSGEKFKFLYTSKHSSLVKLGAVWLNVKTYQTNCPVKNKNFRIDCKCADEKLNMYQQEKDLHTDIVVS